MCYENKRKGKTVSRKDLRKNDSFGHQIEIEFSLLNTKRDRNCEDLG